MPELPALSDLMRDVLDLAIPGSLQVSPDSKSVVYSTGTKWRHRTTEHTSRSIWIADLGPAWAPDGRALAFLSDRGGRGKATAIYLLAAPGSGGGVTPRALTPAKHERPIDKFLFAPDGKSIAFAAAAEKSQERRAKEEAKDDAEVWGEEWDYARLFLCNVEDGLIETIFEQDAHVYDFAWNGDGTQIAIATNPTPHIESEYLHGSDISILDLKSRDLKKVCHHGGNIITLIWAASNLYFVGYNTPGQHTSGFVVYSVNSLDERSSAKKVGYGEDSCAMSLVKVEDEVVVYSEAGMEDHLRFLSGELILGGRKKISDFDAVKSARESDMALVVAQSDMNTPTEVYSVSPSGEFTQLSDHGNKVSGQKFGACIFLECQSLDGKEKLQGLFVTPAQYAGPDGHPTRPLPTLVLMHGGPYGRSTDAFDQGGGITAAVPAILAQGHAVFMPNYRGSSGRGDRFSQYSRGGMGIYDEPDIVALTQAAIDARCADPARLIAGGWSQGGHLAYLSAVRNGAHGLGWRFRGIIAGAGVTDWDTMVLTSDVGLWQAQAAGAAPWQVDGADVASRSGSALWEFESARVEGRIPPMLMLHGANDVRVPITQAWGFRRALDQAGLPFEFVTYPGQGHNFQNRKHFEDLIRRTLRFLQTHLS
ncbi:putative acylamino-acid-releasing enzyme [Thozetella sp. PMI_491]|nr:putative acylamino-acid-releasing enzyme [Thozetella sp. PMI_491]